MDEEEAIKYRKELDEKGIDFFSYEEDLALELDSIRKKLNRIEFELGTKKKVYEEMINQIKNETIKFKDYCKERGFSARSKIQAFMDIMKKLEGKDKKPVLHQDLIRELTDVVKIFTREEALPYVRRLLRECAIYESKPNYYNTI